MNKAFIRCLLCAECWGCQQKRKTDPGPVLHLSFLAGAGLWFQGLKDPPMLEGLEKWKERQQCLPSERQLSGSPWKKCDGALQWDLQKLNLDKRKISEDVPFPAPHNLAVTERRELRGYFEREAAFYLRYSKSSEIPLPTSPEGQAGLSLQVLSGNATLPEGFNLEPRARPFSENPAEKLPSKIIVPRGTPSFSPQRKPGLLERAAQDFPRPPAPGCVLGPGAADAAERARGLSAAGKEKP
ncbi:uncharacterized protein LOC127549271 isoform X2 [Antechinus flavipes]|uniref:uncharacterized protein LOC127549271 isoform X2 n=1 Tax=Antechinus flavipes TaxID=38775 RepID=UPI002235837D|nr:uncharacterized protein LOC127549271 isoform X2 [Antechinus flavipes]